MDNQLEFAVPFAGALVLMFFYADYLVQLLWLALWVAVRYKFVRSRVEQN